MKTLYKLIGFLGLIFFTLNISLIGQQLAFPGAEGYGRFASGGRGGRVIEVTNLKDKDIFGNTIPGSLRDALTTEGDDPITVIFRVSGIITLDDRLKCPRNNITIAGQTAPGDGICIKKYPIIIQGTNVIVRYLRFRVGDESRSDYAALGTENARNVIIDHCSLSWAVEENHTCYDNINTTVQWCILSEGLYNSYDPKGSRSYGSQWGGQYATYHHNLIAHCNSRSPRVNGSRAHDVHAIVDYRNNVIFNWGKSNAVYGGEWELAAGECHVNYVNNYYKPGPATSSNRYFAQPSYESNVGAAAGYAKWYISGNVMEGDEEKTNDNWKGIDVSVVGSIENIKSDTAFNTDSVYTETAEEALLSLIANVGAIMPIRDSVDLRIIGELKGEIPVTGSGTYGQNKGIIDSQEDVGGYPEYRMPIEDSIPADTDHDGMPDYWEIENDLDPNNPEDGKIIADDGYSNLEHYLNSDIPYINAFPEDTSSTNGEDTSTNIYSHQINNFELYPNPVKDNLYFISEIKIIKIELFDITGKLIFSKMIYQDDKFVHLNTTKPGLYFIRTTFVNGLSITKKISIR